MLDLPAIQQTMASAKRRQARPVAVPYEALPLELHGAATTTARVSRQLTHRGVLTRGRRV